MFYRKFFEVFIIDKVFLFFFDFILYFLVYYCKINSFYSYWVFYSFQNIKICFVICIKRILYVWYVVYEI